MKILLDADGHAVIRNGKVVYVHDDGKEVEFDAAGTIGTIARLNAEAKTHREGKEAEVVKVKELEGQLKVFEGLDPEAAKKALAKVKTIEDGHLIDSGKADEVVKATVATYEEKIKAINSTHETALAAAAKTNEALNSSLNNELIGGGFARSPLIAEKLAIPADLVQAKFGSAFKVVDGVVVAHHANGEKIYSQARPGEIAKFDEALEMLVNQYPGKDHILKSSGARGSGASGSGSRGDTGGKGITRAQFEALPAGAKSAHINAGNAITD